MYRGRFCHYIVRQLRPWRLLAQSHRSRCIIRTERTHAGIPTEFGISTASQKLIGKTMDLLVHLRVAWWCNPPPPMKWLTPPLTVPQRAVLVVVVVVCCGRQEGFRRR